MNAKPNKEALIPQHGGYRNLRSFQVAQLVYDVTIRFCDRYLDRRSRTHDQMVQAARSGVQNIAEGSQASGTSKKTELRLTNVARASLEELRLDYEDFLRQRDLPLWERSDPRRQELIDRRCATADEVALWVREVHDRGQAALPAPIAPPQPSTRRSTSSSPKGPSRTSSTRRSTRGSTPPTFPEIAANPSLLLITVACALLDRQIAAQAKSFEEEGGFTERLYRVRTDRRRGNP